MDKTAEEKIRLSFQKLKEDISSLRKEVSDISEKIEKILQMYSLDRYVKIFLIEEV